MHYYFKGYGGSSGGKKINGYYQFFDGTKIKNIVAKEGKTTVINFTSEVQEGELTISVLDSSNDLVTNLRQIQPEVRKLPMIKIKNID
jgi:hypothetical protein